ncbi:MAG TPA: glycosyltransferase [Gaiellaceae bacterium]
MRYLFYSHDGLGLGHVRRNLCVASALSELNPQASILVATSADEAELFGIPPGVDLLKLPGVRKVDNGHYTARRLSMGSEEIHGLRAQLLAAAVESFRPAVLLVDKHPFGVGGELLPALDSAREAGARAVLGIRDVLDDPAVVRDEWHAGHLFERIPKYYDRLLIYGQPDVLDPRRAYAFPAPVAALTRFCGYVASSRRDGGAWENGIPPPASDRPLVLATAGGGEDGFALLSTFIRASAGESWQGLAVSGSQCPPERAQRLRTLATVAGVTFHRFIPKISLAFPSLDALVSMGGYGTLVEAAASGVPTICVPRVRPRREQLIRARAFAHLGLLRLVESERLDAQVLRSEIEAALADEQDTTRGNSSVLDLGGARRTALHLSELAVEGGRARRRTRAVVAK